MAVSKDEIGRYCRSVFLSLSRTFVSAPAFTNTSATAAVLLKLRRLRLFHGCKKFRKPRRPKRIGQLLKGLFFQALPRCSASMTEGALLNHAAVCSGVLPVLSHIRIGAGIQQHRETPLQNAGLSGVRLCVRVGAGFEQRHDDRRSRIGCQRGPPEPAREGRLRRPAAPRRRRGRSGIYRQVQRRLLVPGLRRFGPRQQRF